MSTTHPALIDVELVHEQLDGLPGDVIAEICAAFAEDMATVEAALLTAASAGDEAGMRRARHSLAGLCGNFGAAPVIALAAQTLIAPAEREALQEAIAATIAALRNEVQ